MAARINLVQNDTGPSVVVQLTDGSTSLPVDVSTALSVKLQFMAQAGTTVLDTLTGTYLPGFTLPTGQVVTANYTTPGSGGRVRFNWNPTTLRVPDGSYAGAIVVTYADSTVQTAFEKVLFYIRAAP